MSRFYGILIYRAWETTLYFLYKFLKSGICNLKTKKENYYELCNTRFMARSTSK